MRLIDPSYEINTPIIYGLIEEAGRTCYKSEANNEGDEEKTKRFIKGLISRNHTAMIEHSFMSVRFITDRGVTHELVRHRHFSYAQESTRYCDYASDKFKGEVTFIKPYWYDSASFNDRKVFDEYLESVESAYHFLRDSGYPAQAARSVLPNCLKTEIVVSGNLRSWRDMLNLRAANSTGPAHPDMNRLMCPLLIELHETVPVVFDDIYEKVLDDKNATKWIESFKC